MIEWEAAVREKDRNTNNSKQFTHAFMPTTALISWANLSLSVQQTYPEQYSHELNNSNLLVGLIVVYRIQ
jgi:hypothetical protein